MRQKALPFPLRFLLFLLALCIAAMILSALSVKENNTHRQTVSADTRQPLTVVLDAGHGGEDGGAVSADGVFEKDLNLSLAMKLKTLLEMNGVKVIMTRETDTLLYDRNVDYQGRKKALDLAARVKIGNDHPESIFVSIHMNAYPQTQYAGLQTWYSPNHEGSRALAEQIQSTVKEHLQPDNNRKIKEATSRIYLMEHLNTPAVLVECGFLSNPEEAKKLSTEEYQNELAFLLFLGIVRQ